MNSYLNIRTYYQKDNFVPRLLIDFQSMYILVPKWYKIVLRSIPHIFDQIFQKLKKSKFLVQKLQKDTKINTAYIKQFDAKNTMMYFECCYYENHFLLFVLFLSRTRFNVPPPPIQGNQINTKQIK